MRYLQNTPLSYEISKDLKKEDLSLSDLPLYIHMHVGMVNDHTIDIQI